MIAFTGIAASELIAIRSAMKQRHTRERSLDRLRDVRFHHGDTIVKDYVRDKNRAGKRSTCQQHPPGDALR